MKNGDLMKSYVKIIFLQTFFLTRLSQQARVVGHCPVQECSQVNEEEMTVEKPDLTTKVLSGSVSMTACLIRLSAGFALAACVASFIYKKVACKLRGR